MYEVSRHDLVVELSDTPKPDVGAPLPLVLSDEHCLLMAYIVSTPDPNWDGTYVTVMSPESHERIAIVEFRQAYAHMFGPPNDEAFSGHPLASRGLHPYGIFEVQNSSWIHGLERMNAVHLYHNRERFLENRRHFIFAFHDSTFECVAEGFEVEVFEGSVRSALDRMTAVLAERWG